MQNLIIILFYKVKYQWWILLSRFFPLLYEKLTMGNRKESCYAGRRILHGTSASAWITEKIRSGEPFLVTRYGAVELMLWRMFAFKRERKIAKALEQAHTCAGIFPETRDIALRVITEYQECSEIIDGLGIWHIEMEKKYIKKYLCKDAKCFYIRTMEPWFYDNPWSKVLEGKRVLIIHPFCKTMSKQYQNKRTKLFKNQNILPKFELLTMESVQTAAGVVDNRFATWFDALDYMEQQIKGYDFDIALIGCGAYGLPLAARVKRMGKQAIHMGSALQLLFGVKGRRWEDSRMTSLYQPFINEHFVYPSDSETPKGAKKVENACYWK